MTVLQVCAYAAPYEGNFIKSLKALGEELSQKGHKMIYAFPENAKEIGWCQQLTQITDVYFLPLAKARIRLKTYNTLKKIYSKHPDLKIIHSHFELYDVPITLTAPKNVDVFWHLHDALELFGGIKNRIAHNVQYGFLHKSAKLLSVSQKHMKYVVNKGFPVEKGKFIPNGLDLDRIKPISSDKNSKKYDFLIFGWEFEIKGVDLCVEAVKRLGKQVRVAVVGNENTEKIIYDRYGKVEGIEVLQPVSDINSLYNDCRCFLHISRGEGLSYALLEAVYAGLPVICSDIKENMFAQKFGNVKMVESENVAAISEAMASMLDNPTNTETAVQNAREIIDNEYSSNCWVKNILNEYGV